MNKLGCWWDIESNAEVGQGVHPALVCAGGVP